MLNWSLLCPRGEWAHSLWCTFWLWVTQVTVSCPVLSTEVMALAFQDFILIRFSSVMSYDCCNFLKTHRHHICKYQINVVLFLTWTSLPCREAVYFVWGNTLLNARLLVFSFVATLLTLSMILSLTGLSLCFKNIKQWNTSK